MDSFATKCDLSAASGIQYKHTLIKQNDSTVTVRNISISIHSCSHPMGKERLEKIYMVYKNKRHKFKFLGYIFF